MVVAAVEEEEVVVTIMSRKVVVIRIDPSERNKWNYHARSSEKMNVSSCKKEEGGDVSQECIVVYRLLFGVD